MEKTEKSKSKKTNKVSFFKRIKVSLLDFDKYYQISAEGIAKSILYITELFIIFALAVSVSLTFKLKESMKDTLNYLQANIDNFYIQANEFTLESSKSEAIESTGSIKYKIIFDNDDYFEKYERDFKDYDGFAIAFTKNNITIKILQSEVNTYSYEQLQNAYKLNINFSKQDVISILSNNNTYIIAFLYIAIITLFTYLLSNLLDILALSILGLIICKLVKLQLRYSSIFAISASAMTLPIILNLIYILVNIFIGFDMPQFQIMNTIISYIYLIASILSFRANIIKIEKEEEKV